MIDFSLNIRFEGADADDARLDLYDGATALLGTARAINLVAHAFVNDEKIRTKGDNPHGVRTYMHASKKGCFEERIDVEFGDAIVEEIGASVIGKNFWDYLNWSWSAAVGKKYEPTTPYVKKIDKKNDVYIDEIAVSLENAMATLQRPIGENHEMTITLVRQKGEEGVVLNKETYDYVTTLDINQPTKTITGNVTKYNILNGFGRLYDDKMKNIVSFRLEDFGEKSNDVGLALESMQDRNDGGPGKLNFVVTPILTSNKIVKRYLVQTITRGI